MAAIQKQYTTVSFTQSKLKIQFKFPYMEFPYISFSKEKEFNNACDDHYGDVWLFLISFAREKSHGKNQTQTKMRSYGKNIFLRS